MMSTEPSVFEELGLPRANVDYSNIRPEDVSLGRVLPDGRELDRAVFEALGLTEGEQREVYGAVVELVKNRLQKARSLRKRGVARRAPEGGRRGGRVKPIVFSRHALEQMPDRGATQEEVVEAIRTGEQIPARKGRLAFRKNSPFRGTWKGRYYQVKQVMPIVREEGDRIVVVTVYVFYFGGAP